MDTPKVRRVFAPKQKSGPLKHPWVPLSRTLFKHQIMIAHHHIYNLIIFGFSKVFDETKEPIEML